MKILSLILSYSLLSSLSYGHYKENEVSYEISYNKGASWNKDIPYKAQQYMAEHIQFLKNTYHSNKIILGGSHDGQPFGTYFFKVKGINELRKLLNSDLAIKHKVLNYKIRPFVITMKEKAHSH